MSRKAPIVTEIDVTEFQFTLGDMGVDRTINIPVSQRRTKLTSTARVVRIFTDQGVIGEYLGGSATEHSALPMFVRAVLGRSALAREAIYNDAKQALRQHARMGMSQVDMALWDLAGKWFDVPVYQLLGEQRRSFPAYARPTAATGSRTASRRPRPTPTSPSSACRWATGRSRSTRGRMRRSRSTSGWWRRSASGSGARWT